MVLNGQVVKHNIIDPLPAYTSIHLGGEIFTRGTGYLNEFHLFYFYFNAFPSWRKDREIDCIKAHQWFSEIYKEQILDSHYSHVYSSGKREKKYDDIYYILKSGVLVYFEVTGGQVRILFKASNLSTCEEIESGLKQFRIKLQKRKPHIHLLALINGGLDTVSLEIKKPKLCIGDNYNDDFLLLHDLIRKTLSKKDEKGLVLLHGKPGTGNTSYIRYLITAVKKMVIFLPPNLANSITDPSFMAFMLDNPNTVLVIEDAENVIIDREKSG